MKKKFIICLVLLTTAIITKAQTATEAWPELKAFHKAMSATFHPAEDGNLKPIKQKSGELALKASKLQNSFVPQEFNKPNINASVKKLAAESKVLNELVKSKAKDEIILKNLTALHDRYHEIVGLCKDEKH